ncbi:flavodoxin family protein [Metabacillus arenae]|uniref:Flavodoxin family protein n=1 Tax=Metabacillus arenae TaxID=2771434 RepID=A0A926RWD5_9BACI|nr:flavodoxin family protein [Metabacillus arenae]MBD1379067.1 flavodoxin family protein [Metabacillus arenae]
MSVNKVLIVYYSLSGNTKVVANKIREFINDQVQECDVLVLGKNSDYTNLNIEKYDLVFIGSPTYGTGNTPEYTLAFLRYILKYNNFILPSFAVFGTGDTQWANYTRAIDEIKYHLEKKTTVIDILRVEQRPVSVYQISKIKDFADNVIRRTYDC